MDSIGPEELAARLRELRQDLLERERALYSAQKAFEQLTASAADREMRFRAYIAVLSAQVAHWKHTYHCLVESRTWKLTAPLRMMGRNWRRVNEAAQRIVSSQPQEQSQRADEPFGGDGTAATELHSPSKIPESAITDQMIKRFEIVEGALREMLAGVRDNTESGKYVHKVSDHVDARHLDVKTIAFYTPQYVGDRRGPGTEVHGVDWGDITTVLPHYVGHYQPHVPDELGHCDQRLPATLQKQATLASQYGIYGFCFHYRSLASDLFTDPVTQILQSPTLEIRFCLCFGNESVSIAVPGNTLTPDGPGPEPDVHAFLDQMASAFSDARYIRIGGKPLIVVSGAVATHARDLRDRAIKMGLQDFYLIGLQSHSMEDAGRFDAIIERAIPTPAEDITPHARLIDQDFRGRIYSYPQLMERHSLLSETAVTFKAVLTGFDNEPLQPGAGASLADASPTLYARWLNRCCRLTMNRRANERFVFISSWNDWAEGAHLEPDRSFGYAYLHATANVLRYYHREPSTERLIEEINGAFSRRSDVAIIFHCHYEDLIEPIFERCFSTARNADLFVTVRFDISREAIVKMQSRFPNLCFLRCENRGRDIRPFLFAIRHVNALGYRVCCKVHTKKSPQAENLAGESWRHGLLERLLGTPESSAQAVRIFNEEPDLGLLVPAGSVLDLHDVRHHIDNTFWLDRLLPQLNRPDFIGNYDFSFPAGSMYWFRMEALEGLDRLVLPEDGFEHELGQRDGTLAHAIERIVPLYASLRGFQMKEIDLRHEGNPTAITGRKSIQSLAPLF